jgi:hypothetical protein
MPLFLNESAARRQFKDVLGNANHLIITILVGLFAVEQRLISECPVELRAAWNPKDPTASANRSRVMMLQMSLVRATQFQRDRIIHSSDAGGRPHNRFRFTEETGSKKLFERAHLGVCV